MTDTTRYRHRTPEVEAVQWTGSNAEALRAFAGADFDEIELDDRIEDPDQTAAVREADHGTWRGLKPGDWVVKLDGGLYEFSATDFAKQYEPAVPSAPPSQTAECPQCSDRAAVDVDELRRIRYENLRRAERAEAAIERVRSVLESEAVVGRSALDYRGLITSALMAGEAQQPTPCSQPNPCEDGELCGVHEVEQAHADGEHEYCGVTCEVEFPSDKLRNTILYRAIPGSAGMLDELLRRAAAGQEPQS